MAPRGDWLVKGDGLRLLLDPMVPATAIFAVSYATLLDLSVVCQGAVNQSLGLSQISYVLG